MTRRNLRKLSETAPEAPPHSPELMRVEKVWRKGVLQSHIVDFSHDCGLTETITQEELPWLTDNE